MPARGTITELYQDSHAGEVLLFGLGLTPNPTFELETLDPVDYALQAMTFGIPTRLFPLEMIPTQAVIRSLDIPAPPSAGGGSAAAQAAEDLLIVRKRTNYLQSRQR